MPIFDAATRNISQSRVHVLNHSPKHDLSSARHIMKSSINGACSNPKGLSKELILSKHASEWNNWFLSSTRSMPRDKPSFDKHHRHHRSIIVWNEAKSHFEQSALSAEQYRWYLPVQQLCLFLCLRDKL